MSDQGFSNPVFAGQGSLVRAQIMSPNFNIANPGASPANSWALLKNGLAYMFGLVLSGGTITGPDYIINASGIFIYSGTPANGNLIGSWAGAAGTDGFGNAYPQGFNITKGAISGTTFSGTDFIVSTAGAFFYSGTPALGNLIASISNFSGTDSKGNAYYPGFCAYGVGPFGGGGTPAQITQVESGGILIGLADQFTGVAANGIPAVIADGNTGGPGVRGALTIQSPSASALDAVMEVDLNSAAVAGAGQPNAVFFGNVVLGFLGSSTKPTGPGGGPALYVDAGAIPRCLNSSGFDGTVSVAGRDWNGSGTINSTSFTNILSVAVASGRTYKFDMMLFLNAAHSAGQWQIQVAGPTFSLLDYNFKWTSGAGVTALNTTRTTLSATQSGPNPSVAGPYWAEIHGFITTTAAGHLVIKAASSTGATDTWTYDISSFLEVLEIA